MKEKVLISSISKRSANTNWIVGIFYKNKFTSLSIGEKSSITMSPRFKTFLVAIEQKAKRYPIDVTFNHLQENREIDVKFFKEEPIYIDGSFSLNKLLQNARFHFSKEVKGNPLSAPNKVFKQNESVLRDIEENIASANEGYIMIANIESVVDGDTIHVKPKYLGAKIKSYFKIDTICKIRYNGIDTPEKKINGETNNYKEKENQETAKVFGVSTEAIYEVAQEASDKNFQLLGGEGPYASLVLLVLDRDDKGVPAKDSGYGRYIADVYATRDRIVESVQEKIKNGHHFVHVNKTLLVTRSKSYPNIPLATYSIKYTFSSKNALNPMGWLTELEIEDYDSNKVGNIDSIVPNTEPDRIEVPESTLNTRTLEFAGMVDPTSNALDFFDRYDDRFSEFVAGIQDEEDLMRHTRTRIGDVILQIPPTSIRVNKKASVSRLKTLRTKSSILINSGQTMTTLTMDLYFHDLEAINGRAIPWKKGSDKTFYVDGLRPLLAQFAKCPFVPIDNYYINSVLGINDVALLDIDVNTVPNFPESMVATITLVDFNCEAYFLDKSCLSESINYPLMRWFYNTSMADRGEKYRVFKGLTGPLDDAVSFTLADSEYLESRKRAVNYLKQADSPEKRRADFKASETVKEIEKDMEMIKRVFDQKDNYQKLPIKEYSVIALHSHGGTGSSLRNALQKKYGINKETAENAIEAGNEWFFDIYKDTVSHLIEASNPAYSNGPLLFQTSLRNFIDRENLFIPPTSQFYFPNRFEGIGGEMIVDYSKAPYKGTEKLGLFLINKPTNLQNQTTFESKFKDCFNKKTNTYAIPATQTNITVLKQVAERKKVLEDKIDEYEAEYQKHVRIVEDTEAGIPMNPYEINGRFITTNVSASFSNEFSMIKTQSADGPTFQYLGGGDPSITMVFEMDETSAKDFRKLLDISDGYCKTYNQGITNGFIGIQNDLANLFGIRYIMIEDCQIDTVEGFPGRLQVVVTALGFDKTQKQREELVNIPGYAADTDLNALAGKEVAYANNRMLEARLNCLEVYPDLELPTYEELNAAIEYLDIGNGVKKYENRTNGLYVDPDFYFSTNKTFRNLVNDQYRQGHQLNMYDSTGVAVATRSDDQKGLIRTTEENWKKLTDMDDNEEVQPLNWVYQWKEGEQDEKQNIESSLSSGDMLEDKSAAKNPKIKAFLDDKDSEGNLTFYTFPTYGSWRMLFPTDTEDDYRNIQRQPSESEIYIYLDQLVDEYFSEYYHSEDMVKHLQGANAETKPQSILGPCYASPDDYYAAYYYWQYDKLNNSQKVTIKKLVKDKLITEPKQNKGEMKKSYLKGKGGEHPKERIMTQLRAFLTACSNWTHSMNNKVLINSDKTRVGLCYADIGSESVSLIEAKKLIYSWRYNLEAAVRRLSEYYKRARELHPEGLNFDTYCRPLDMMIYYYDNPEMAAVGDTVEMVGVKKMKESELCSATISAFSNYRNRPYDTQRGYNNEVLAYHLGEEGYIIDKTLASKEEYISELLKFEYYDLMVLEGNDLTVSSGYDKIKPVMEAYLNELTKDQVFSIYTNHICKLRELANKTFVLGEKDENGYLYSANLLNKAFIVYRKIESANKTFANSQAEVTRQLVCSDDPQTLYRTMFYEMRRYDQRGRMIRAFPSFAMFIIHEGDEFGKYKFWDNTFGFNAIESIDIHRSRKIAADTAIINMSNVYSNLTTRRTDVDYLDRQLKFWDNMILNNPPDELVEKRKNETYKSIYLETGARIHLRIGYGSNAQELPVVFNGTITEIEMGDVIQIVGQGDGLELGNVISGDPGDNNDGLFCVTEPRDLICKFLASKGSWMKDFLNRVSSNRLFGNNPLGIAHFGQAFDTTTHSQPLGTLIWSNDEYGEVAQNIYSSNGTPTFSQWLTPAGKRDNIFTDFTWKRLWENKFKIFNPGDEPNIVVSFYNQTVWDIIQTVAYASPDYICAVHPFETRSTLFFGKPYWPAAFGYDSRYQYDSSAKTWSRYLEGQPRRSYMQHRFYTSFHDIIENNICASEDGLFTNVIVNYDGHQTPILFADVDIRYDKLKTRSVEANIVAKFADFYTSEVMATHYGCSVLRDNLKDMYKGSFLVVGDPSVKPHDMFYLQDERNDMNGTALVKSVTHHFSAETGFVTKIEPDLLAVNDDEAMFSFGKWASAFGGHLASQAAGYYMSKKIFNRTLGKWLLNTDGLPKKVVQSLGNRTLESLAKLASNNDKEMKAILKLYREVNSHPVDSSAYKKAYEALEKALGTAAKNMKAEAGLAGSAKALSKRGFIKTVPAALKALKSGKNILSTVKTVANVVTLGNPVGAVINAGVWIGSELLFEHYRRFKENLQTVIIMPLTYQGKELTAGVNSHAGLVYGESPGKIKSYFDATFGADNGDAEKMFGVELVKIMNFLTGSGGKYKDQKTDEMLEAVYEE